MSALRPSQITNIQKGLWNGLMNGQGNLWFAMRNAKLFMVSFKEGGSGISGRKVLNSYHPCLLTVSLSGALWGTVSKICMKCWNGSCPLLTTGLDICSE